MSWLFDFHTTVFLLLFDVLRYSLTLFLSRVLHVSLLLLPTLKMNNNTRPDLNNNTNATPNLNRPLGHQVGLAARRGLVLTRLNIRPEPITRRAVRVGTEYGADGEEYTTWEIVNCDT